MYRPHIGKWVLLPVVLIALLMLPCAFAQETTTAFQGSVKDPSGAVITGATIEVSGPALIGTRRVQTDASGNYRFAALPPGEYTMTVSAVGFRTYKQSGIDLTVGRLPNIEVQLQVGTLAETVEVSGRGSPGGHNPEQGGGNGAARRLGQHSCRALLPVADPLCSRGAHGAATEQRRPR